MTKKSRNEFFLDLAKIRIRSMDHEDVKSLIEEYGVDKGSDLDGLAMALQEQYSGITNGFLSEVFEVLYGEVHEFEGEVSDLFKCPCCQYKTLDEIYNSQLGTGYDICPICRWEDDGTENLDSQRAINKGSLSDYRKKLSSNYNFYYREKYRK